MSTQAIYVHIINFMISGIVFNEYLLVWVNMPITVIVSESSRGNGNISEAFLLSNCLLKVISEL